jgi:hypothetical protein
MHLSELGPGMMGVLLLGGLPSILMHTSHCLPDLRLDDGKAIHGNYGGDQHD